MRGVWKPSSCTVARLQVFTFSQNEINKKAKTFSMMQAKGPRKEHATAFLANYPELAAFSRGFPY